MDTIIEHLISDFQERNLPQFTPRHVKIPWLPNKIDTVIGMRRAGKTWFLFQIISDLLSKGASKESVLYLNLEDERLLPMTVADLQKIPDVYYRRYPHFRDRECTFFFDEIQNISGWERFIRRLLDTENVHICLTGSSAKLLSREIATSLRGRSISTEIFPFSFWEMLDHNKINIGDASRPSSRKRALLENRLRSYLLEGGFPEVQGIDAEYRVRILQDYLDVVILRDLVERHRISNTVPLRYMIRHLLNASAGLFSVNKFYNDLKSQGIACGKNTLHEYLDHLSDAYLFFQVPIHTRSERVRMVNPRKIYTIDTGLVQACSRSIQKNWGHLLENFVFMELRRSCNSIEYYRTEGGQEVDFLVTDR
ncbi:ATP-binding protein, partial [Thermodesulfobacteriota bacterium]